MCETSWPLCVLQAQLVLHRAAAMVLLFAGPVPLSSCRSSAVTDTAVLVPPRCSPVGSSTEFSELSSALQNLHA